MNNLERYESPKSTSLAETIPSIDVLNLLREKQESFTSADGQVNQTELSKFEQSLAQALSAKDRNPAKIAMAIDDLLNEAYKTGGWDEAGKVIGRDMEKLLRNSGLKVTSEHGFKDGKPCIRVTVRDAKGVPVPLFTDKSGKKSATVAWMP